MAYGITKVKDRFDERYGSLVADLESLLYTEYCLARGEAMSAAFGETDGTPEGEEIDAVATLNAVLLEAVSVTILTVCVWLNCAPIPPVTCISVTPYCNNIVIDIINIGNSIRKQSVIWPQSSHLK